MISCRVNERRYEFGDEEGAVDWVCAKVPSDGRVKKDCVPKVGGRMFKSELMESLRVKLLVGILTY